MIDEAIGVAYDLQAEAPAVAEKTIVKGKMEVAGIMGPLWMMGWLFTIGFLHLTFWKGVWALVVWPYYLGAALG